MKEMQYVSFENVICQLDDIRPGDILYIISDILSLSVVCRENGERFDCNLFIDSILRKVGPEGTVLIPTFNWGFCKGETFDIRKTVSKTGALGNAALRRADFKRSKHPLYSFMIWGKDRELLTEMDPKDAFGADSVFGYLHRNKAKALVIGLPTLSGLTFIHYVEQMVGVPYRYSKDFTAGYIDDAGVESQRTYSMYVRDLDMDPRHIEGFKPLGDILENKGISLTHCINGVDFHIVDLEKMYAVVEDDILNNDSKNMYHYNHSNE